MCEHCRRYREQRKRQPREPDPDEEVGSGEALYRAFKRQLWPRIDRPETESVAEAEPEESNQ